MFEKKPRIITTDTLNKLIDDSAPLKLKQKSIEIKVENKEPNVVPMELKDSSVPIISSEKIYVNRKGSILAFDPNKYKWL